MKSIGSYKFMGITVNPLTLSDLKSVVNDACKNKRKYIIGHHNLHSLYLLNKDKNMQRFYQHANFIHIDGMPIIWLGRFFGYPLYRKHRLTSLDWLDTILEECESNNIRIFLLGSRPGVAEKAAELFGCQHPGLEIKTQHGYFDVTQGSNENKKILNMINSFRPHILMVGMGMPRQEKWIIENYKDIDSNILWSLGAFMDYYAGEIPTPPRWMGKVGLEWLYRLLSEPTRLWKRYLIEPLFILKLFVTEIVKK